MPKSCVRIALFCAAVACLPALAFSQSPVATIEIAPTWNGGAQSPNSIVTIRNTAAGFRRIWDPVALAPENNVLRISVGPSAAIRDQPSRAPDLSQDVVAPSEVSALAEALRAPALLDPELANLGISSAWLAERAANTAKTVGSLGEPNDARQQEFFRRSFTDVTLIEKLLPRILGASWTDDPVWVRVKIQFAAVTRGLLRAGIRLPSCFLGLCNGMTRASKASMPISPELWQCSCRWAR